jgi:hypothetical protein
MADRFKQKILLVDKAGKCSDQQLFVLLVHGMDLGVPALEDA